MSLLLDALKKAEEAKRLGAAQAGVKTDTSSATTDPAGTPATTPELALEPHHGTPKKPPASPLPELSAHLDTLNADLAAMPTSPPLRKPQSVDRKPPPSRPATDQSAERATVRNAFAAKRTPPPNRLPLWIALGIVVLAAVAVGAWFWWQLAAVGNNSLSARPLPPAPTQAVSLPPSPPAQALPPPSTTPVTTPATPSVPLPMTAPVAAEPGPLTSGASETQTSTQRPPRSAPAAPRAPTVTEPESPVRITRGVLRVNPVLSRAYEQLQADKPEAAAQSYKQVLQSDPKNVDALLGMATIALRLGQPAQAEDWYLRALEADPRDANAQAGLINLRGQTDPAAAESRLKTLLAAQPESPTLNFALGNLYAGQRRWAEAQLAFFHAHTAEPGNPDYLFNLAASLDHLHMPKLALEYYQSALAASTSRKAAFDTGRVRARILELQP